MLVLGSFGHADFMLFVHFSPASNANAVYDAIWAQIHLDCILNWHMTLGIFRGNRAHGHSGDRGHC